MKYTFRILFFVVLLSFTFFTYYVLAASATDLTSTRGEGASNISGWNVSNIHYRLANDPSHIAGVEFDLDGPASEVRIDLSNDLAPFVACYSVGSYHWSCKVEKISLATVNQLRIVALE